MPNINKFKSGHLARNFNFQYLVHIYQEPSKINKFTFKVLFLAKSKLAHRLGVNEHDAERQF